MAELKLMALDAEDLHIVSACCQDAVMKAQDVTWEPQGRRFILVMNRFAWEAEDTRKGFARFKRRTRERRRSVLHFAQVVSVRQQGIATGMPDEILDLLAIRFIPAEAPTGVIELVFAGDATIRLQVECIEAQLSDLGAAWSTDAVPDHDRP